MIVLAGVIVLEFGLQIDGLEEMSVLLFKDLVDSSILPMQIDTLTFYQ
jgi:hypothetical protein